MEAATAVHQMISKWLDCAMCLGAFHYQSSQFDDIKPPAFGSLHSTVPDDQINGRERVSLGGANESENPDNGSSARPFWKKLRHHRRRSSAASELVLKLRLKENLPGKNINCTPCVGDESNDLTAKIPIPTRFQDQFLNPNGDPSYGSEFSEDRRARSLVKQSRAYHHITKTRQARLPTPSLFLQETAHLISLLSAVALSTLRNDIDQAASPVTPYVPGMPWPCVDPDMLSEDIKRQYGDANPFWSWLYFCLGLSRSQKRRTLYNAARPFGVLGGVSDEEIRILQHARGPYAKMALVTMWLEEFISREYLAGSTGNVSSPIISRLYQFISDGVVGYNQARKVAYIPFPFPNGQITAFFSLAIIFIFPLLFISFVNKLWFACVMNFLTVLCFLGLHEVARELESPFQNVPNDLPLATFQAQLNEALVTIYAGYHPDGWWEVVPEVGLSEL
jgi:Bestrophin, RFP-TM, chloride channel